ncbi:hypothetical protein GCM10023322_58400 [Rugosimonospora acidiphila]|uniref:CBM2 domain-containing protein n=1 Tax=Rugosimonospora acidiphila TaxID=556531 RepID=A0ABP9SCU1_9ACTN
MSTKMFTRPLYLAVLAAVAAAGLAIVFMPDAQATSAPRVDPLTGAHVANPAATDTEPPTTPTGLGWSFRCDTTSSTGTILITLTWTASTDNVGVTGYDLFAAQGVTSDSFALIATTTTTSYTTPVFLGRLELRARDAAGNTSDFTAPRLIAPPPSPCPPPGSVPPVDTQPPTMPANLTASFSCDGTRGELITLNWAASTDNVGVTGYDVYATGSSSGSFGFVATAPTTSYTQAVAFTRYEVRARDAAGNTSAFTAPLLTLPPPSPCPTHSASPPPSHGTCSANYSLGSTWPNGFQGQVTVTNTGSDSTNSWTVTLTFANGQTITQVWGAGTTNTASPYTFNSLSYDATLSPGASTTFGFLGSWSGTNTAPVVTCVRTP